MHPFRSGTSKHCKALARLFVTPLHTTLLVSVVLTACQPAAEPAKVAMETDPAQSVVAGPKAAPVVTAATYESAERFLSPAKASYGINDMIMPTWIGGEDRFWYKRALPGGEKEFVIVDAATGDKQAAFDHALVAAALTTDEAPITANTLPFDTFTFNEDGGIDFSAGKDFYHCTADDACTASEAPVPPFTPLETPSPDGQWAVYHKDHNLWLKSADGKTDIALTTDGEDGWGYGTELGTSTSLITMQRLMGGVPPQVSWSPDSSKILTQRVDERQVKTLSLTEEAPRDGSLRPRTWTMRYALAGDEVLPQATFVLFDVPAGKRTDIDYPAIELVYATMTGPNKKEAWWAADSRSFGFAHRKKYAKGYSLHRVDIASGQVTTLFNRSSETTSAPGSTLPMPPMVADLSDGGFMWYSDESGYGHLYRRTADGQVNQVTQGDWNVTAITHVDEAAGRVYFMGSQAESDGIPYFEFLYSVNLDGSDLKQLTPEQATHRSFLAMMPGNLLFSPSRKYFIDQWSATTKPNQTELRDLDGILISVLETTDISALEAGGFVPPEPFTTLAADGTTTLYGTLHFPSHFDPAKSYPIIDSIYPGPQSNRDNHDFSDAVLGRNGTQALAELGFIVMTVDGRGTPGRSRDFHFPRGGNNILDKAGYLEDHIATMKQLAQSRSYIDIDRVGIYGWSGGGYASTHAMFAFPDFFKVAVSGAGNHDPRTYLPVWGESYLGTFDSEKYEGGSNAHMAANLKGKLFLVHGALDDNVPPGNTFAVVDALIQANKSFDLLVLPNANHGPGDAGDYFMRRQWDYFVTHLLGATPPENYAIGQKK